MAASDFEEQFLGHSGSGHQMSIGGRSTSWRNGWGSPRSNSWQGTQAIYDFWIHLPKHGPIHIEHDNWLLSSQRLYAAMTTHVHKYELRISGMWHSWMHDLWRCDQLYFWSKDVDPGYWHFDRPASVIDTKAGEEVSAKFRFIKARELPRHPLT